MLGFFYSLLNKRAGIMLAGVMMLSSAAHALETPAQQAVLYDVQTHHALFSKEAHTAMAPSSMSKLMTVYVAFDRLKKGQITLDTTFPVSENAWRKGGSKTFVALGSEVSVADLLRGIIVQSGNDACIVIAEGLAGTEDAFAREMNRVAKELGLKNSNFMNATGWPDEQHYMTAYDLAVLSRHLIEDFPEYYAIFAEKEFAYNNIHQQNRNHLLGKHGIDGLKTGHTEAGGYGIAISAEQSGRRLIAVVNGLDSEQARLDAAEALIVSGFHDFENQTIFSRGQVIGNIPVWLGSEETVPLVVGRHVTLSLPRDHKDEIKLKVSYDTPLAAPVARGDHIGEVYISIPGMETVTVPLVAGNDSAALSGFQRILPAFHALISG